MISRWSTGRRLAILAAGCLLLAAALPASAARLSAPHHGVVNGILQSQVRRLLARHTGVLRSQKAGPAVRLEMTSTQDESAAIRALGGVIEADIGGRVLAARVPASAVAALVLKPGVSELYPVQRYHFTLDRSVPETGADRVWATNDRSGLPIQGNGAIVGLVDSGIDYHNPDFINPDGTTRILSIWDQSQSGGPPSGFTFGTQCDQVSIQNGSCPERDTDGHGTHVAGIMASNGRSGGPTPEIGMAPRASIMVVKTDLSTDHVLAAWKYLVDRAAALHRPIVINNSFGGQISPHDGSEPDSLALDQLAGPGRIFVAAAGNEAGESIHTSGTFSSAVSTTVPFETNGKVDDVSLGLFYSGADSVDATLSRQDTGETFHVAPGATIEGRNTHDGHLSVTVESDRWNSHTNVLYVDIQANNGKVSGAFSLQIQPDRIGGSASFDGWMGQDEGASFNNPDESDTIADPADGRNIIAVGNYATRTSWVDSRGQVEQVCDHFPCQDGALPVGQIAMYSSVGPTADGRQKPDLAAPGTMIISSLSRDAAICSGTVNSADCLSPKEISQDGLHMAATGTSMSSPHVAGAVALMLQVYPTLDQQTATDILRRTARHDAFTGPAPWTPNYGAGKLDAYAAVQDVRALPPPTPAPTATATRIPSPTATPTATPLPPPDFHVVAVRADRKGNASGWNSVAAPLSVKIGTRVDLSVYTRFGAVSRSEIVTVTWQVTRGGKAVFARSTRYTHDSLAPPVIWNHVRFTPMQGGRYTFVGSVSVETVRQLRALTFTVTR